MSVLEFYRRNSSIHYSIAEDALHLGLAECERLREQLDEAKEERDQLLEELVRIFKWEDPSFLHAILHVENAITNTWADLAVEKGRTKRASLRKDLYLKDGSTTMNIVFVNNSGVNLQPYYNMQDDRDALALELAKRESNFKDMSAHIAKIEGQRDSLAAELTLRLAAEQINDGAHVGAAKKGGE